MRRKIRGTLQIHEDVKRLFMLAKPLNVTSSEFLQGLLILHARAVREAQLQSAKTASAPNLAGVNTLKQKENIGRVTCLGRPPGAKDLLPRNRRTKKEMAQSTHNPVCS